MNVDVWEVTPHLDSRYDNFIIRVSDDQEGRKAIDYAKQVLESKWDAAEDLSNLDIQVRVRRMRMDEDDIMEDDE